MSIDAEVSCALSDVFKFTNTGSASGAIDAAAGVNTLDYSGRSTAINVNLQTKVASAITGGFNNIQVAVGDGSQGWPPEAPYNVILVAAAARGVPPALVEQLADGGRMVIPVAIGPDQPQDLRVYVRRGAEVGYRSMFPVLFVPLRTG